MHLLTKYMNKRSKPQAQCNCKLQYNKTIGFEYSTNFRRIL